MGLTSIPSNRNNNEKHIQQRSGTVDISSVNAAADDYRPHSSRHGLRSVSEKLRFKGVVQRSRIPSSPQLSSANSFTPIHDTDLGSRSHQFSARFNIGRWSALFSRQRRMASSSTKLQAIQQLPADASASSPELASSPRSSSFADLRSPRSELNIAVPVLTVKSSSVSSSNTVPGSPASSEGDEFSSRRVRRMDRATSISSVSSERQSISNSLNRLRARTKSFLLLDPASSSLQDLDYTAALDEPGSFDVKDKRTARSNSLRYSVTSDKSALKVKRDSVQHPSIGRSVSFNDRKNEDNTYSGNEDDNDSVSSSLSFDKTESPVPESSKEEPRGKSHMRSTSRQRSKTLGSYDKLANLNGQSRILNSLTNFVKIRRPGGSNSSSVPLSRLDSDVEPSKKDLLPPFGVHTPSSYLDTLLKRNSLSSISAILALEDCEFLRLTFREYLKRYFHFADESLDMALREFLLFNDLPKEVQQIDRVIYQFGKYYSEEHLNTGIDVDTCYILAYALIMLQTDRFNPNNKHKMTRWEFVDNLLSTLKETEGSVDTVNEMTGLIVREVLGYFYDNIVHSRFAKILPIQCGQALEALEDTTCTVAFPYPSSLALTSGGGTSSSSSIKSSSQVSLTSPLLRRGSFPWSPPSIDVYEYVTQRKLNDLRLGTIFHRTNPFLGTNLDTSTSDDNISARGDSDSITVSDDIILPSLDYVKEQIDCSHDGIDYELLHKFVDAVNGPHCSVVLKVPKVRGAFLDLPGVQNIAYQEEPPSESGKEYYLVRVIKLGMMSRQESKLRYTVKSWKRYFCLLTPVGMFFFKSLNLFRMVYLDKNQDRKTLILEKSSSGSTTSTLLESSEPSLTIFEGASATRTDKNVVLDRLANDPTSKNVSESPLRNFTFYIYTRNSRNVYMVDNQFELKSWINSINYLSAFATIELPIQKMKIFEPVTESIENDATAGDAFTEVTCAKTISIDSRLSKLCSSIESSSGTLVKYLQTVNHLELLTPLEPKTRDELISSSKILNVKLEWLWYELSRDNELYWLLKAMKEKEMEGSGVGNVDGNEESQNETTGHDGERVQEEVLAEAEAVADPDQHSLDESST